MGTPFAGLLQEEVKGLFFLRGVLDNHLVSGQLEIVIRAVNEELNRISLELAKPVSPIFTFEMIPGKSLDNVRMVIKREAAKPGELEVLGHMDFRQVLVDAGSHKYPALFFDVTAHELA